MPWLEHEDSPGRRVESWLVKHSPLVIEILATATVILTAATAVVIVQSFSAADRITKLEDSPCTEASQTGKRFAATEAGRTCNRVRRDIAKRESLRNQCIAFERVTGRTPPLCPHPGPDAPTHDAATHDADSRNGPPSSAPGGGGTSTGSTPPSQTSPPPSGGGSDGGDTTTVVTPPTTAPAPETPDPILNVDPNAECQVTAVQIRVCLP